ncbi:gamma-aminobutyric acid receptor subunit rho-2-like [Pecten maximus]|uniref:gamma-aminobutyric acid receptor subunit rho-2-like n=1 Tax=Pecten maximus TaxID=6579 RepID=UPI001458216C|nr:gamma-aminobutyric acid receptor subunit rho-2-like [Pecten maximus]XP_033726407.1 gamma-aminobutyric acid receptor subunit rho-2-like [Pecten maximus]XP_033726408.1 gamma-aminobutyric acid receptor subunit rho-2-like [Pecten maximus]XP_033726409.1 gamma-aminobutyric acid receptor subunit rho-2-like [Pecten maximus]
MDNRLPPLKNQKKQVYVKVVFLKVGEIDTIKENFVADVFIQARWREAQLDNRTATEKDLSEFWSPRLLVHNVLDASKDRTWKELVHDREGAAYVVEKRRIKGHFSEKLELMDFPFDYQSLSLQITSELSESKVAIEEDNKEISAINVSCFVDEQEWLLYDFVESVQEVSTREFSTKKHIQFPWLVVGCSAVRRAGFFVWNVIMIMTLISSISLATFAVDRSLPQNRLQLSITLMLTSVTFKSVASANIPKISYYTHLDRYVLFGLLFTYIVCIWHAVISRFNYDVNLGELMDFWAFMSFLIIFLLFHFTYGGFLIIQYLLRRKQLTAKEMKYEEKALKLLGSTWKSDRQLNKRHRRKPIRMSRVRVAHIPEPEPDLTFLMVDKDDM